MRYKKLGNNKIGGFRYWPKDYGRGRFFTRDTANDAPQVELLEKGIELSLNLIDTAETYGGKLPIYALVRED